MESLLEPRNSPEAVSVFLRTLGGTIAMMSKCDGVRNVTIYWHFRNGPVHYVNLNFNRFGRTRCRGCGGWGGVGRSALSFTMVISMMTIICHRTNIRVQRERVRRRVRGVRVTVTTVIAATPLSSIRQYRRLLLLCCCCSDAVAAAAAATAGGTARQQHTRFGRRVGGLIVGRSAIGGGERSE